MRMMKRCVECGSLIFSHRFEVKIAKDEKILKTLYTHERCIAGLMKWVAPNWKVETIEIIEKVTE